ncbi:MAG: hypothetical protein C0610_09285 [Desulfobacteraceae bacterium]|nr:MAG: hypothetical protein C0610_09285 [Desulfobacteraceae bacterium]
MGVKVSADATTRVITVTQAPVLENGDYVVDIDVQVDLYSDLKEDWVADETLRRVKFPIRAVGGDPLPGSKVLGDTYFIRSDWKIAPYEANHRLRVNGNFYSEDGTSPFNTTQGNYNLFLEQTVSSLVDSTIAQLPEIQHGTYNGGVTVDLVNGVPGTDYPIGTPSVPSNNFIDAVGICVERGFGQFYILGDATVGDEGDYTGMIFVGESKTKSVITILPAANIINAEFYDATVTGTLDGNAKLRGCNVTNLNYVNGFIEQCVLSAGTILLGGGATAHFLDCWSGTGTPVIDLGGSAQNLELQNFNGRVSLKNKTGASETRVGLNSGHIILQNTVTGGSVVVQGVGKITDEVNEHIHTGDHNGCMIINELTNPLTVAEATRDVILGTTQFPVP